MSPSFRTVPIARIIPIAVLTVAASFFAACDYRPEPTGELTTMPVNVNLGSAGRSKMEFDLSAGELHLSGGAAQLLEGSIAYNVPSWKPEVITSNVGSSTDVTVKQPSGHGFGGNTQYVWNLQVNDKVLLDLSVNCGAGRQDLKLGDANLRNVTLSIGAGQVDLDLRGHPTRDYDVSVSGGVGQATVKLPQGVGLWAQANGGIGNITVEGLHKTGDHWENDLYDTAKVNVHVKVEGGVGQIQILAN